MCQRRSPIARPSSKNNKRWRVLDDIGCRLYHSLVPRFTNRLGKGDCHCLVSIFTCRMIYLAVSLIPECNASGPLTTAAEQSPQRNKPGEIKWSDSGKPLHFCYLVVGHFIRATPDAARRGSRRKLFIHNPFAMVFAYIVGRQFRPKFSLGNKLADRAGILHQTT